MSKAKTVTQVIKLVIKAGNAKPGPPVGAALGSAGLKIIEFTKDFNAKTSEIKEDVLLPVAINAYSDKTFDYVIKTPPVSFFVKKAIEQDSGSKTPGHSTIGSISAQHVYEIAAIKQLDTPWLSKEAICKSIMGTCRSMGVAVVAPETQPAAVA